MTAVFLGCGNADDVVDYIMMTACSLNGLAKVAAIHVHMEKVSIVFDSILEDWSSINEKNLQDIMRRFAKTGRSVFIFQATSCCMSNFLIFIGALPFLVPPVNETIW
ncbi:hypothetical protein QAD02_004746 [Eretmocerus hayati]|uniref:Uncharacterized protein n=1 Tax=Eretmocerus hayati TaxID=131215 RepID=A0ACC2NQW7_9HYME|nr:hypothetical protein QAD02_004746 [Eretmocerus hayati]